MSDQPEHIPPNHVYYKPAPKRLKTERKTGGFPCPECRSVTLIVTSRPKEYGQHRRRVCTQCHLRFGTDERFIDPGRLELQETRANIVETLKAIRDDIDRLLSDQ